MKAIISNGSIVATPFQYSADTASQAFYNAVGVSVSFPESEPAESSVIGDTILANVVLANQPAYDPMTQQINLSWVIDTDGATVCQIWTVGPYSPPVPTLAQAQQNQLNIISSSCSQTITGGFQSSALGSVYTYPSSTTNQMNLAASVAKSLLPTTETDAVFPFWSCDSSGVWNLNNHTASQIQQVGADIYNFVLTQIQKNAALSEQVQMATTPEQVQAITW